MSAKTTPIFLIVLAAIVGYIGYSGLEVVGVPCLSAQKAHIVAVQDTITKLEGEIDKAKKALAKGPAEDPGAGVAAVADDRGENDKEDGGRLGRHGLTSPTD